MSTWGDLQLTLRRSYLKDSLGKKWDDDVLLDYANAALIDLAGHAPAPKVTTLTCDTSGLDASTALLPTDMLRLDVIFWPTGERVYPHDLTQPLPEEVDEDSDLSYLTDYLAPNSVTFFRLPPATGAIKLLYGGWYPTLNAALDSLPTGSRRWLEPAMCCYIAMLANLREGVSAASLEQWKQRPDLAVGNPLNLDAAVWFREYQRIVRENKDRGYA